MNTKDPPLVRCCPVCARRSHRLLHRQEFVSGLLGEGYDVVVCGYCGAGFASGIPSQAELTDYYENRSKYAYGGSDGEESSFDIARFRRVVQQVLPYLTPDARIMDVGCATGGLLSVFKSHGFMSVLGADPSPACASAAMRLHGIDVVVSDLDGLKRRSEKFDLITLVGVLEHLCAVGPALHAACACLNPGGQLYVAVPDVAGLTHSRNAPFTQFSMEHVNFFSEKSLNNMLTAVEFEPLQNWHEFVEWRETVTEPILSGLYRKGSNASFVFDELTEPALEAYIFQSRSADRVLHEWITRVAKEAGPLFVWGAGALTRRLLKTSGLGSAAIIAYIDSNPHLHGTSLAGRPVLPPSSLTARKEPVLICSVAFQEEIAETIRNKLRLKNPLIMIGI